MTSLKYFFAWPVYASVPYDTDTVFPSFFKLLFAIIPTILLILIYVFRKNFNNMSRKNKDIMYKSFAVFALCNQLWFDLSSVISGDKSFLSQLKDVLIMCRLNTYLISLFIFLKKYDWLKWIFATTIFGGFVTLYGADVKEFKLYSYITHGYIIVLIPSMVLLAEGKNYSFNEYIQAFVFSITVVFIQLLTNLWWGTHAGELKESWLGTFPIMKHFPYGSRIIIWIIFVVITQQLIFLIFRFIFHITKKPKKSYWNLLLTEVKAWTYKDIFRSAPKQF